MRYVPLPVPGVQETCAYLSRSRVSSFIQVPVSGLHWRQLLLSLYPPHKSPEFSMVWPLMASGSRGSEQRTPVDGTYNSAVYGEAVLLQCVSR